MVYSYKNYYFESQDGHITLGEGEYYKFVEDCRKFIIADKNATEAKCEGLTGK